MTFEEKDYEGKLDCIEKYYKNDTLFFAAYLNDYNNFHIYIRIDYVEKFKGYRLRWFDLDFVKSSRISKYESSEYVERDVIETIQKLCAGITIDDSNDFIGKQNNIEIYIDAKCKNKDNIFINLYKYIPENYKLLYDIMTIVFEILPKKLSPFLQEIGYIFSEEADKFEYEKRFIFDLFEDNLDKLFNFQTMIRGTEYYIGSKVLFLEKIDDRYFAVVNGSELYLVIIKYDENSKDMQVYCSCPCQFFCKHIFAVIMAIRESHFKPFYKVIEKNNNIDMFDRLMNFSYRLSIGLVEDVIGVVGDDGCIEWRQLVDEDNKPMWSIIEDDDMNRLTKAMTKFLDSIK